MPSFDVVSKVDIQELDNAVNQARKELSTRYDFQGTNTEVKLGDDRASVQLRTSSTEKAQAAYEVLLNKMAKRGISLRAVTAGPVDTAALGQVKQTITIQQGIAIEKAKEIVKLVKDSKMKVSASIQGDQLRVTGKNKDDLQDCMALLRKQQDQLTLDLQFNNFRD